MSLIYKKKIRKFDEGGITPIKEKATVVTPLSGSDKVNAALKGVSGVGSDSKTQFNSEGVAIGSDPMLGFNESLPKGSDNSVGGVTGGGTTATATAGADIKGKVDVMGDAMSGAADLTETIIKAGEKVGGVEKVKTVETAKESTKVAKNVSGVSGEDKPGMSASTSGMIGAAAGVVSGAIAGVADDGDAETWTDGEAAAMVGGEALAGVAAGAQFGPVGMLVGGALGAAKGAIASGKAKAAASNLERSNRMQRENDRYSSARNEISDRAGRSSIAASLIYGNQRGDSTAMYGRNGLKFDSFSAFELPPSGEFDGKLSYISSKTGTMKFKRGGKIKAVENIIPNGVLHEESNKLGDKGMPVVYCSREDKSCEKQYEIEKDEMIFTLETTKKVEELAEGGKLDELGIFITDQILDNTHSFTNKFKELNGDETIFN